MKIWKFRNACFAKALRFFCAPRKVANFCHPALTYCLCALSLISQQLGGLVFQCLVSIFLSKYIQYDGVFAHLVKAPSCVAIKCCLGLKIAGVRPEWALFETRLIQHFFFTGKSSRSPFYRQCLHRQYCPLHWNNCESFAKLRIILLYAWNSDLCL